MLPQRTTCALVVEVRIDLDVSGATVYMSPLDVRSTSLVKEVMPIWSSGALAERTQTDNTNRGTDHYLAHITNQRVVGILGYSHIVHFA